MCEGYRLVRLSFFPRTGPAEGPSSDKRIAEENDRIRQIVDQLFYRALIADKDDVRLSFQEIANQSNCRIEELFILNHRLKQRLAAYAFARLERRSNREIRLQICWIPTPRVGFPQRLCLGSFRPKLRCSG